MICNMNTNSGLQISVFPQEGLPSSYSVCSGLFLSKISDGNPYVLMMTLLYLPTRWQASILSLGKSQPTFLKILRLLLKVLRLLFSSSFCLTDSGIPATSKHSLLEYWAFAQHCLSKSITLHWSKELTFYVTSSFDSRLVNLSLNLRTSSGILVLDCIPVILDCISGWGDSTIFIISFLTAFLVILQNKFP